MRRHLAALASAALLLAAAPRAGAQQKALPDQIIALDTEEGRRLLLESTAREDYWRLSATYVTQKTQSYCGVASAVMVLNALPIAAPAAAGWEPYRTFTQENFFNEAASRVQAPEAVSSTGLTLEQLAAALQAHPAKARVVYAGDTTEDEFRALVEKNLSEPANYIIVNYDRAGVGQEPSGHFSPLAAYHAPTDRILLMDVARYKYPPAWVAAKALWAALRTDDFISGRTRGLVVVEPAPSAPGPSPVVSSRSPMRILYGAIALAFGVGGALGAVVTWLGLRRRFRTRGASP